ncbi:MAG: P-type DNA transfer ATPase VirB11 [Burkholderia sp.]|jgi:type IV secretion system protein VirB11|uniref:P-type DNA transfer ATPase VirB11 n=2 Tax=Burkholderiaceae TaxID=119060 RepID=UPI001CA3C92F|nr:MULTISPECIES: P-type DNA transfer ATPase VirB11 [Burkholderia]MBY8605989.1 P-type DNA transfer ATPase VirB11 [Burkholderia arboris]MCA3779130.1 P-type DNA transfer ATPase VirB11 [Burkholderia sp.]MCA3786780.1 P-type DNA transfer ATPase VirB11 [Burkholderia sp.]MCA3812100.1 P-type DNA transfer ATPase VirB11 [Burkholderia sp.]MCA3817149.1 P-type DNA transfer ATPase VirB11 [Burkholderia sp.]
MKAREQTFEGQTYRPADGLSVLPDDASVKELMRPFAPLLADATVTELVINRPQRILTETHLGWQAHELKELDFERLMAFAVAVATLTNQGISAERPLLSALLPGDARIQIVVPPVVPPRTVSVTIRRPAADEKTLDCHRAEGLFEQTVWRRPSGLETLRRALQAVDQTLIERLERRDFAAFFEGAVRARRNIVIVGSTGSGKTSFMRSLCRYLSADERIVTIEDVRELFIRHLDNCVHLLYSKGAQGRAHVRPADLIASAMRMRPDRVLLAELRGAEAYDFLKLLTTGHAGSMTSFHASSASIAIERFALMAKEHPEAGAWDIAALKRVLLLTIDVVAHMEAQPVLDSHGAQIGKRWAMTEVWFDPREKAGVAVDQHDRSCDARHV